MRIIQLLTSLSYGDAVGNDALAMQAHLLRMGFHCKTYAEFMSPRYLASGIAFSAQEMPCLTPDDILLYHLSTGSALHALIPTWNCKKIAVYHNITPCEFFVGYSPLLFNLTQAAYEDLHRLRNVFDYILADSEFNKQNLLRFGYTCPIDVLPILIPYDDYRKKPAASVALHYADGRTNLLFVGRIAPNKKQEDVIAAYAAYKRDFNPTARLFLVGNYENMESYYASLQSYCTRLGLTDDDVVFPGHISFAEVLAYYSISDLFLSMSEHEGFCVPLVEAMLFGLPILAYAGAAVPETLGGAGLLLETKQPALAACAINRVLTDPALRDTLAAGAQKRLDDFSTQRVSARFEQLLLTFLDGIVRQI